jgi:hypothetical protein
LASVNLSQENGGTGTIVTDPASGPAVSDLASVHPVMPHRA